ncbi:MAG: hypothetical protein ACOCQD_01435 [archaeon]
MLEEIMRDLKVKVMENKKVVSIVLVIVAVVLVVSVVGAVSSSKELVVETGEDINTNYELINRKASFNVGEQAIVLITTKGKFESNIVEIIVYAISEDGTEYIVDGNQMRVKPEWNSAYFPVSFVEGKFEISITMDNGKTASTIVEFKE